MGHCNICGGYAHNPNESPAACVHFLAEKLSKLGMRVLDARRKEYAELTVLRARAAAAEKLCVEVLRIGEDTDDRMPLALAADLHQALYECVAQYREAVKP